MLIEETAVTHPPEHENGRTDGESVVRVCDWIKFLDLIIRRECEVISFAV